jgi:hypothetical protein
MCESRPRPLYGTAAHRHAKRQQMEDNCGADLARVRLLCASGEEDIRMGGSAFPYCTEGEILGSIVSGSGDCFGSKLSLYVLPLEEGPSITCIGSSSGSRYRWTSGLGFLNPS